MELGAASYGFSEQLWIKVRANGLELCCQQLHPQFFAGIAVIDWRFGLCGDSDYRLGRRGQFQI